MPLTGSSSFIPVLDEFIPHWASVDTELGVNGPLVLPDGLDHAGLVALRGTLVARQEAVRAARMEIEFARNGRDLPRDALLERLIQFNGLLRVAAEGTYWTTLLPVVPSRGDAMGSVIPALEQAADAWLRYEVEHPTLTLAGGYARTDFATDVEGLRAAYTALVRDENGLRVARGLRTETERVVRSALSRYRAAIAVYFAEDAPVRETLPRLSPLPGHTPDAPVLQGEWDAESGEVVLEWTPPEDKSVVKLQLRATRGPKYDTDDERVLANFSLTDPPVWRGTADLAQPGQAESFKLYAVTVHGNEKGSKAVTVTRPAG